MERMRGELAAQARYLETTTILGQPHTRAEEDLFIMLARWLSTEERNTLLAVVHRQCVAAVGSQQPNG